MEHRSMSKRKQAVVAFFTAAIMVVLSLGGEYGHLAYASPITENGDTPKGTCLQGGIKETREITISAVGDCTLGNDEKQEGNPTCFHKVYNLQGPDYFLAGVKPIFAADDLTIANLEGVITNLGTPSTTKNWRFRGSPDYLNILKNSSVEAVSFANNHCRDYGEISHVDTMANLDLYGIPYSSEDNVCVIDVNGIKVGLVSIQCAFRQPYADPEYPDANALAVLMKTKMDEVKEAGAQLIIVNCHWGVEMQEAVTPQQYALAHFAVDQGADLVIGHHPHMLQAVENYNGKYILYSLGNFCFGGNSNPPDKDTCIWQMRVGLEDGKVIWQEAQLIPCRLSSHTTWNDYRPVPLTGAEAQRVIGRMNRTSNPYGVVFNEFGHAEITR